MPDTPDTAIPDDLDALFPQPEGGPWVLVTIVDDPDEPPRTCWLEL